MTSNQKTATIKHTIVVILSFILPLVPQLLTGINFGVWTNIVQAALALLGAINIALQTQPTTSQTVSVPQSNTTVTPSV